jgi:hypothetical protein
LLQKKKQIIKSERISPRDIHKQEIVNNFKSTFFKGIGAKDDPMAEGKTPRANRTSIIDKKPKTPITMQRRLTREPSP